jgi:hypothetical protein
MQDCTNSCGAVHLVVGSTSNAERKGPNMVGVSFPIPYNQLSFSSGKDLRLVNQQLWDKKEDEKKT